MLRREYGFIIHWRSAHASSPIKRYGMGWSFPGRGSGWQKFQRVAKLPATSFHSSSVLGQLITSSRYSSTMAPQTSRTIRPMLLLDTRKPCIRVLKLMPVARYLRVMASFSPGVKARLKLSILPPAHGTWQVPSSACS